MINLSDKYFSYTRRDARYLHAGGHSKSRGKGTKSGPGTCPVWSLRTSSAS